MSFQSLEDAVFNSKSLADPAEFVIQSGRPNELFSDRHGGSIGLLHYMVMVESKEGASLLLDIGADPNVEASDGSTPLWTAMIKGNLELIQLLVENGADVNARRRDRNDTPLHAALINDRADIAEYLLDHGADPDAQNDLGISPRQVGAFKKLRRSKGGSSGVSHNPWSSFLHANQDIDSLLHVLNMCEVSLPSLVSQGRISATRADLLRQRIAEFKEILSLPEAELSAQKIERLSEFVTFLTTEISPDRLSGKP